MIISVQLLRFVAASLVVLTHSMSAGGANGVGAFGVDIFFVISGFIISHVTNMPVRPGEFLMRRGIRIIPMYWLFTLGVAVLSLIAPSLLGETTFSWAKLLYSLAFVPHWNEAMGWSPLLKLGWTLNHEMFFYLIFAIAMQISHKYRELLAALLILCMSMVAEILPTGEYNPFHYWTAPVTYEFIFGMALAVCYRRYPEVFNLTSLVFPMALFIISMGLLVVVDISGQHAGGERYLLWGGPSTVVVWCALASESHFSITEKGKRIILWLGDMSYPVYLIHIYIVLGLSRVLGLDHWPLIFCVSMVLAHCLSHVVTQFYDMPIRSRFARSSLKR